jgi:hypothetical protein
MLAERGPRNASDISALVKRHHPDVVNAHLGGPSLWRFFDQMQPDDLVIISGDGRRQHVMRVIGQYNWDRQGVMDYGHWRAATSVAIDPDELWRRCGSRPAAGENIRWTLFRCLRSASE